MVHPLRPFVPPSLWLRPKAALGGLGYATAPEHHGALGAPESILIRDRQHRVGDRDGLVGVHRADADGYFVKLREHSTV